VSAFDEFIQRGEQFTRSRDRNAMTSNLLDLATGLDNPIIAQSAAAVRS